MITGVSDSELEEVVWGFDQRAPFRLHTVASLVPPIFERYARIFHPAMHYGIAGTYDVSWRDVTMRTGRTAHALMNWDNITATSSYFTTTLAEPVMGTLPDEVSLPLRRLLAPWSDLCCFGIWDGWGDTYAPYVPPTTSIDTGAQRVYNLFIGPVTMLDFRFFGRNINRTANVIWALNHRWWLIVDIDFITTYVGGDQQVIESLIECDELEVWSVQPDDDITVNSDQINR